MTSALLKDDGAHSTVSAVLVFNFSAVLVLFYVYVYMAMGETGTAASSVEVVYRFIYN